MLPTAAPSYLSLITLSFLSEFRDLIASALGSVLGEVATAGTYPLALLFILNFTCLNFKYF